MAYSPYQIAGTQSSLYDLLQQGELRGQESRRSTSKQKGKLKEEFEEELKQAQAKARRDSKPGFLSQALSIAGMGLGPLGAGLAGGISAGIQGDKQKQALKGLLSGVDSKRWGKTFLSDPMKQYKEEAQDLQMSSGDVLRGAVGSGLTSFATSKMLGGDKESGGLFQKMFSKPGTQAASGVGIQGPDFLSKSGSKAGLQAPDFLKDIKQHGLSGYVDKLPISKGIGIQPDLLNNISSWSQEAGKMTPFKTLFEELGKFGQDGEGFDKEFQQSMMMPQLIQMIMGQMGGR